MAEADREDQVDQARGAGPRRVRWRRSLAERLALIGAVRAASPGLSAVALGVTVLSAVLVPLFNVTSGSVVGAVEAAVRAGDPSGGPGGPGASMAGVVPRLALATGLYLLMHLLGPVSGGVSAALMRRVDTTLTLDVMRAMSRPRSVAHLEDPEVLDQLARAQGSVSYVTPGMGAFYLAQSWRQRLQGSLSLLVLVTFSPWLAAALLAGHLVAYRWRRWHSRQMTAVVMGRAEGMRRSAYVRRLAVQPEAAKEARVFSLAPWFRARYRHEFLDVMQEVWRRRREGTLVALAVTGGMLAVEGGALAWVAWAGVRGHIDLGATAVYAQTVVAVSALSDLSERDLMVTDAAAALRNQRALERAAVTATVRMAGTRSAAGLPRRTIRFEGVHFAYPGAPDGVEVYTGLDLEIEAGRSLAIVGQNGAGKTTLVKLLARLHDPTAGRITVDGIDLRDLDPAEWQRRVAAIFQDFVCYRLSAADNVAFGALHVDREPAVLDRAAALAGAHQVVAGLPHGWDTVLSRQFDRGTDLSGGEWQRMALARAVYAVQAGAGVLILDEPTAALDVRGEAEVYDRFLDITRGRTTVVVSHRFSTVRRADRIVVVEHGQVVEDGDHDGLVAAGGRYASMYELQAHRFRDANGVEETGGAGGRRRA